jgi:chemotaxis-related protein WspD
VHCRNCPVYARAGALLLNRPLPADYRRAWTAHYANAKRGTGNGESGSAFRVPGSAFNRTSVTLFRLGPEWLALETTLFQEVAEHRLLHSLPHRRQGVVLGLVNVRGELLICISLARLLALEDDAPPGRARPLPPRLMVVSADANRFAFPVDEVYGVHRFNREELQEPPATVARAGRAVSRGVFRWQAHTVGYLDSEALCANVNRSLS